MELKIHKDELSNYKEPVTIKGEVDGKKSARKKNRLYHS